MSKEGLQHCKLAMLTSQAKKLEYTQCTNFLPFYSNFAPSFMRYPKYGEINPEENKITSQIYIRNQTEMLQLNIIKLEYNDVQN